MNRDRKKREEKCRKDLKLLICSMYAMHFVLQIYVSESIHTNLWHFLTSNQFELAKDQEYFFEKNKEGKTANHFHTLLML